MLKIIKSLRWIWVVMMQSDVNHQAALGGLAGGEGLRTRAVGGAGSEAESREFPVVALSSQFKVCFPLSFFLLIRHMLWIRTVICFYWLADEKHGREKNVFTHLLKLPLGAVELGILFFDDSHSDSDIFFPLNLISQKRSLLNLEGRQSA